MLKKFYLGSYTSLGGQGIYQAKLNSKTGELKLGSATVTENPSFLVIDHKQNTLYCVNETGEFEGHASGSVSSFAIEATTGNLTLLNQQRSGGTHPCHLAFDPLSQSLFVANYGSGSVAKLPILASGALAKASQIKQPQAENKSRAHFILTTQDGQVFVTDLGLDQIFVYQTGKQTYSIPLPTGSGPRHLAFHPYLSYLYVICEHNSTLTSFKQTEQENTWQELQTVATIPADFGGENTGAHLSFHPSGRFLYASNRGHNSLAIFAVQETGVINLVGQQNVLGKTPRHFSLDPDGEFLLVANQDSNNLVSFKIEQETGLLNETGFQISVPAPVCVQF